MATTWSQRPTGGDLSRNKSSSSQQQQQQQEIYGKLREYEARRRLAYSAKYDSISLYWKSYCDLLSASLKETSRAQRIVLGTSHAYLMYADAMLAISEDSFLDDKGNITTEKQKKKVASGRRKMDGMNAKSSEAKDAVSVLKEIREAQSVLAERFEESSKNMDEEIAAAIGQLLDTVQEAFIIIERLGSSILTELERTEQEVTQAWGTCSNFGCPKRSYVWSVVDGVSHSGFGSFLLWHLIYAFRNIFEFQVGCWNGGWPSWRDRRDGSQISSGSMGK
jgi:hypothetical protein